MIGFVACSAHQVDMGGAAPGSQKVHGVTEAFQEGLRILPVRFVREGKIDEDIMRIVLGNVRVPDKVRGDLLAQHNAELTAAVRLKDVPRLWRRDVDGAYDGDPRSFGGDHARAAGQGPAGTYSFEDQMDDYGPGTEPIRMAVDITFDGKGEVEFDFSRSSDTVPAALNSYINYTRAYAVFAIKTFCNALDPQTEGSMRPIKLRRGRARSSIRDSPRPRRAADRADPHLRHHQRRARPGAAASRDGRLLALVQSQHRRHRRSHRQAVRHVRRLAGGYGGRAGQGWRRRHEPGDELLQHPRRGARDAQPRAHPALRVHSRHGRRRAMARRLRHPQGHRAAEFDAAVLSHLGDRHVFAPYGIFGGKPGALAESILNPHGNGEKLHSKETRPIKRGDVLSFRLSGAGGYGPPEKRDAAPRSDATWPMAM